MIKNGIKIYLIMLIFLSSCNNQNKESELLELFSSYYTAVKNDSEDKWNYSTDTVKLWFDDKEKDPVLQIKEQGTIGKWKEWDDVMNTTSFYDSIWYDKNEHAIKGYFYEKNDFYTLIGKPHTKTYRTYWLNDKNKINKILIYWIPGENISSTKYLIPIVAWAMQNDSLEIQELYPDGRIIPSRENALRWKALLIKYRDTQKPD